jgi:uncharacterized protein YceH (UPF0502 family)
VKVLARQPGTKEARYTHLLSGDVPESVSQHASVDSVSAAQSNQGVTSDSHRLAQLEDEVAALRTEVTDLKNQLAAFQKQFQ